MAARRELCLEGGGTWLWPSPLNQRGFPRCDPPEDAIWTKDRDRLSSEVDKLPDWLEEPRVTAGSVTGWHFCRAHLISDLFVRSMRLASRLNIKYVNYWSQFPWLPFECLWIKRNERDSDAVKNNGVKWIESPLHVEELAVRWRTLYVRRSWTAYSVVHVFLRVSFPGSVMRA